MCNQSYSVPLFEGERILKILPVSVDFTSCEMDVIKEWMSYSHGKWVHYYQDVLDVGPPFPLSQHRNGVMIKSSNRDEHLDFG